MTAFRETKFRKEVFLAECSKTPYTSNVQWVQFLAGGGGGQKSIGQISAKDCLAELLHLFPGVAPHSVQGPQILAHQGSRFLTNSQLLVQLSPHSLPGLENVGGIFFPSGVMTPRTMIWAICSEQKMPLTSSSDSARYLSISVLTSVCFSLSKKIFTMLDWLWS